ncbi:MAG TPA: M23 family metallopeptidase [Kofleriaceae bacterium]|nr:M23 family metallopeptidase [Kofleriaceae bacterium]
MDAVALVVRWILVRRAAIAELVVVAAALCALVLALTRWDDRALPWPVTDVPPCDGFDFPVGPPDAIGYYDAQPFGRNDHLGNDWNGNGGGNTDLGDPVFAAASGVVIEAIDIGGDWGNVVRIVHACGVESVYAHLDLVNVVRGATVMRGQLIGTIGTAHGTYPAHLHFELRDRPLPLGGGYDDDTTGYLDPTAFIRAHRPR